MESGRAAYGCEDEGVHPEVTPTRSYVVKTKEGASAVGDSGTLEASASAEGEMKDVPGEGKGEAEEQSLSQSRIKSLGKAFCSRWWHNESGSTVMDAKATGERVTVERELRGLQLSPPSLLISG